VTRRVAVIGAGVIGLSIAEELARHGDQVEVIADVHTAHTVSSVSAALWFPYRSERSPTSDEVLHRSLLRFTHLADQPDTGVYMRVGTVIEREENPDRSWVRVVPDVEEASAEQLPTGATSGLRARLPLIVIPEYLPWLRGQAAAHGVRFRSRTVTSLSEFVGQADLVVIAAGIRGGELLGGDPHLFPVRGQIVRLANPGLTEWVTDDQNPAGLTYVFPRNEDVIVGGVAAEGSWDCRTHAHTERAILDRARLLVPALRDQAVLGRAAGLRPARASIRVERLDNLPVPTIAAYGHGGAGVTLSWGTAERVRDLSHTWRVDFTDWLPGVAVITIRCPSAIEVRM